MQNMWYVIIFINVWLILTAIRLPFCSPSHVSRTSGQILRELVWCGLRSWCKHEWTAVEQMASWRVLMSHSQTTVWRWQGPPTAALWRTPYAFCPSPKHLPWRILLQWSPLQTTKLHYYYLSILKRFNNWNTNIAIGVFFTWKFKSLGSSGRNFWWCLLATLLRSPGSGLLASGSLRSQFSTMISSTMVLAALKML